MEIIWKDELSPINVPMIGAFSKMPAFDLKNNAAPSIDRLLQEFRVKDEDQRRPIVIIDSIDEILPESAKSLLMQVDEFVRASTNNARRVQHFFIIGRPEGFADYYKESRVRGDRHMPLELRLVDYQTIGDLTAAARFVASLVDKRQVDADAALRLINQKAFLRETPYLLSTFAELIKTAKDYERRQASLSERRLKELFFQSFLARNQSSHGRPTIADPSYSHLFEKIAMKYSSRVDKDGFFLVALDDFVEIEVERNGMKFNCKYLVQKTLSRSGVAYMNPVDLYVANFRFYPAWLHEHLIDRATHGVD